MSLQPESLEFHIRVACRNSDCHLPDAQRIFDASSADSGPILSRDKVNRILLYTGAFNPPHLGHLKLLEAAMQRSTLNHIAAIVLPYEDEDIQEKLVEKFETGAIVLTMQERAKLWRSGLPENLQPLVWPTAMGLDKWTTFLCELKESAEALGFKIEADVLFGPDSASSCKETPISWGEFSCVNIITSNATRAWWAKPEGQQVPTKVLKCDDWKLLVGGGQGDETGERKAWKVWKAWRDSGQDGELFFVESPDPPGERSSTKIRELMRRCGEGEEGLAKAQEDPLWQEIVGGEAFAGRVRSRWPRS